MTRKNQDNRFKKTSSQVRDLPGNKYINDPNKGGKSYHVLQNNVLSQSRAARVTSFSYSTSKDPDNISQKHTPQAEGPPWK